MGGRFASGKHSIAICDRCGFRTKLHDLRKLTIKTRQVNLLVCRSCWEADHPQLKQGMYPVLDPQAVRDPRPDNSYLQSGATADGSAGEGSRNIQWGWKPVGLNNPLGLPDLPNALEARGAVGKVTVLT